MRCPARPVSLKEVSSTLVNQLGGLTKRFEEQGTALVNASRTFEMSELEGRRHDGAASGQLDKLMENVGARAADLDRMMNSYSNMLEQSLSQAELRARKVTELLAKDSAEKSQAAIREIERLRQDAQVHTQKAVTELQANFSSLSDQVSTQLTTLSSKFSDTTGVCAIRPGAPPWIWNPRRPSFSATQRRCRKLQSKARRPCAVRCRISFGLRCAFRYLQPPTLFQRCFRFLSKEAEPPLRDQPALPPPHDAAFSPRPDLRLRPAAKREGLDSEQQQPLVSFQPEPVAAPCRRSQSLTAPERRNQWSLGDSAGSRF